MENAKLDKFKFSNDFFSQALTAFFIFFLVYTAGYKALNLQAFQFNIGRTGIFSGQYLNVVSYAVILIEAYVIINLLINSRFGVKLYTILMGLFTTYIILLYYTGRYEVCGCGGILNGLEFKPHLLINVSQIILGSITMRLNSQK